VVRRVCVLSISETILLRAETCLLLFRVCLGFDLTGVLSFGRSSVSVGTSFDAGRVGADRVARRLAIGDGEFSSKTSIGAESTIAEDLRGFKLLAEPILLFRLDGLLTRLLLDNLLTDRGDDFADGFSMG
jgi:hypothetical protein